MPEPQSAADLRARLAHHAATKAAAESKRARLVGARDEAGSALSDGELDELDREVDMLAVVIERAGTRIAMLRPTLVKAEAAKAAVEERTTSRARAESTAREVAHTEASLGRDAAARATMDLNAAGVRQRPVSPTIFDPLAPKMQRNDEQWWADRNRREGEARASRLAIDAGSSQSTRFEVHDER